MGKVTTGKLSKSQVDYMTAGPGGPRCGLCSMFRGPNRCVLVAGNISRWAWCRRFSRARA